MSCRSTTEQLRISSAVRNVQQALCSATNRRELETGVCEVFAESEPYVFAWIGEHDTESDEVVPRAAAGVDDGYLDDISISVHESPSSEGPTATAVRTGEIQKLQHIRTDPEYEPWREQALERGFESSAAVPIASDSVKYGVLNVYSDRPAAFDESERQLLSDLGLTIATAIDNIETRVELEVSKRKYETLTERISDAYYAVDAAWRITYWNEQMATRTETPASAVQGEVLWDAFPELIGTEAETRYREAMASQEPCSFEQYLGEPFDYWVDVDVYPDADGLSIFSRDITPRKEHEQELRETRTMLQAIIEAAPDPIVMLDEELRVQLWNPGAERLFGWSEAEIIGERAPFVPDERDDEFAEFIENLNQGEPNLVVDTVRQNSDGELIDVSLSSARVDVDDDIVGYLGVFRDIRRQKQYERQLEDQRDSLEVLNQVVRHDIRNDLQLVQAYAELLADRLDDEEYLSYVQTILDSAGAATELTHSAGDLAEVLAHPDGAREPVALRGTLESQLEDARTSDRAASVRLDGSIPNVTVTADAMLSSVFRNLLKNAIQHNDDPRPEVSVDVTEGDDTVTVRVADNGPGIADDRKESVFGKGEKGLESDGTGIGLYLVNELVTGYGGDVWIEDAEGGGTTVVVELSKAN